MPQEILKNIYIYIYIYMNTFILYLNIEEQDGSASFSYVIFSETL